MFNQSAYPKTSVGEWYLLCYPEIKQNAMNFFDCEEIVGGVANRTCAAATVRTF